MQTYGEWRYSPTNLNVGTRWRCQFHVSAALPSGERKLDAHCIGWWVGRSAGLNAVDREKYVASCWESNPGCSCHTYIFRLKSKFVFGLLAITRDKQMLAPFTHQTQIIVGRHSFTRETAPVHDVVVAPKQPT
jgi:hypothetical protein